MDLKIIKNAKIYVKNVNICKFIIFFIFLCIIIMVISLKKRNTKSELVKQIIKENKLNKKDEKDLIKLINEPISIDIDKKEDSNLTFGEKLADKVSQIVGSWKFIICFISGLISWAILNLWILKEKFDPYPFILLNLLLSCISAIQAPIIMMSQNRKAKKDTKRNQNDYKVDIKSELILEDLHKKLDIIIKNQSKK